MEERGETQHQVTLRKAKEECETKYIDVVLDFMITLKMLLPNKKENTCLPKLPEKN